MDIQSWGQTPIATTQSLRVLTSQPTQSITQSVQTTTQPIQITNVVIPSQNTTTIATQNTITLSNIFNLTSQLIGIITEITAGRSNS